jgi:tetratricopeptide (TPR) repeat protein
LTNILATPMRAFGLIAVALPVLFLSGTQAAETSPTRSNSARALAELELGNTYRAEKKFEQADAAYSRAIDTDDAVIRQMALAALADLLREERDYGSWLQRTADDLLEKALKGATLICPVFLVMLIAWNIIGWIGTIRGGKHCVIVAAGKENSDLTALFRLAYLGVLAEFDQRRAISGPIGLKTLAPTLESATTEDFFPQLVSIANEKAGRLANMFWGRLKRPQYRLSLGSVGDQYQTRLVVSLEVKGRVVEVWSEEMAVSDLFQSDCRFLLKIVAYVEGYANADS